MTNDRSVKNDRSPSLGFYNVWKDWKLTDNLPSFNATGEVESREKGRQAAWQLAGAKSEHGCSGIEHVWFYHDAEGSATVA